jgi:hypothetical protein
MYFIIFGILPDFISKMLEIARDSRFQNFKIYDYDFKTYDFWNTSPMSGGMKS